LNEADVVVAEIGPGLIEDKAVREGAVFEYEPGYESNAESEACQRENGFVAGSFRGKHGFYGVRARPAVKALARKPCPREDKRYALQSLHKGFWLALASRVHCRTSLLKWFLNEGEMTERAFPGRNEDKRGLPDGMTFEVSVSVRRNRVEGEFRPPFANRFGRPRGVAGLDGKPEVRMLAGKSLDEGREDRVAGGYGRVDPDDAPKTVVFFTKAELEVIHAMDSFAREGEKGLSFVGEGNLPRVTLEEWSAELFFDARKKTAQCRGA